MAEKGREEFHRGMAVAAKEWIESGILREQRTPPLPDIIPEDDTEDYRLARLHHCELQETRMSLGVVRRLRELVRADGSGKHTKGSIGIDLLSVGWLNSGIIFYSYFLFHTMIYLKFPGSGIMLQRNQSRYYRLPPKDDAWNLPLPVARQQ